MIDFLIASLPEEIEILENMGDFRTAVKKINEYLSMNLPPCMVLRLRYEKERIFRLRKEYSITMEKAREMLKRDIRGVKESEIDAWLDNGWLDCRKIDKKMRCFNRFEDNLIFSSPSLSNRRVKKKDTRTNELLLGTLIRMNTWEIKRYRITAGIKMRIRKKYEGERFRVWLPVPKENFQINNVRVISSSPEYLYVNDGEQKTAYFETRKREIKLEFSYEISEVSGGIEGKIEEKYTREKYPHIIFSPYLKNIANTITEGIDSELEKARRIYEWVTSHMRYFYVKNYGTYENIGEYAATNLKGDCGFHAILFIVLARISGIPAKWQSGWFITPYYAGSHDWAQVNIDGKWYPVDASFGNLKRHTMVENEFYFGNLDAFRMIANDDIAEEFYPKKKFWRSDPVDNQVGEVENEVRNIYYDGFSWKIYLKEMKKI